MNGHKFEACDSWIVVGAERKQEDLWTGETRFEVETWTDGLHGGRNLHLQNDVAAAAFTFACVSSHSQAVVPVVQNSPLSF